MFEAIWSTLYGLLVDDGQLAVGAILALAVAWVIAYAGGDRAHEVVGWALLAMVLVLVVANLYRAGLSARRASSTRR
jgi:thiosulfate reductase cytochrome b subunit